MGDIGIEVADYRIVQDGKDILLPLAKEVWDSTIINVNVLINGCKQIRDNQTSESSLFENTLVQQCLVMLVTGLEVYTKNRFLEMEKNGRIPNTEALVKEFASSESVRRELDGYSHSHKVTTLQSLIRLRNNGLINFQDWEKCKRAFNKGYNIKFAEIKDLNPTILENIKKYCQWRHKIIHSKKYMGMLNMEEVPPKEPIFATIEFIEKARNEFKEFIEKLHAETV
ncbi:MAG TPA: HEPN domain-containing protein [Nitrososphaeraceae archaeon]|nr:HEPN domain-containing protein [Nitrososphaeraceae archaeon]